MSKAQESCLTIAKRKGDLKLCTKLALLIETAERGTGSIILDQAYAHVSDVMSVHQWAGYISALTADGFYEPCTDREYRGWGFVVR